MRGTRTLIFGIFLVGIFLVAVFAPPVMARWLLASVAMGAVATVIFFLDVKDDRPSWEDSVANSGVDPWAMQRALMKASDQALPDDPVLSKGSLMYAALIMEEAAETFCQGIVPALDRFIEYQRACGTSRDRIHRLSVIRGKIQEVGFHMTVDSPLIRKYLAELPEFRAELKREEAVTIFDGTTDLAVVNCGFALASGLDGAAGYLEVGGSNLSKANPSTGKIDKTADGKWIKGRDYRAPDLAAVLDGTASERGLPLSV